MLLPSSPLHRAMTPCLNRPAIQTSNIAVLASSHPSLLHISNTYHPPANHPSLLLHPSGQSLPSHQQQQQHLLHHSPLQRRRARHGLSLQVLGLQATHQALGPAGVWPRLLEPSPRLVSMIPMAADLRSTEPAAALLALMCTHPAMLHVSQKRLLLHAIPCLPCQAVLPRTMAQHNRALMAHTTSPCAADCSWLPCCHAAAKPRAAAGGARRKAPGAKGAAAGAHAQQGTSATGAQQGTSRHPCTPAPPSTPTPKACAPAAIGDSTVAKASQTPCIAALATLHQTGSPAPLPQLHPTPPPHQHSPVPITPITTPTPPPSPPVPPPYLQTTCW